MINIDISHLKSKSYLHISDLSNRKIILRSCLNVGLDHAMTMIDDTRYQEALPCIRHLAQAHKLIIIGHLGRPTGYETSLSLKFLVPRLSQDIGQTVFFAENVQALSQYDHGVILLDNIRFDPREESSDLSQQHSLAQELTQHGDIFVNDAFADYCISTSTYTIATYLPAYLGPLFVSEVESLNHIAHPHKPLVAVIGGSKLSEKLQVLSTLLQYADQVIIGGAMACTLLAAQGVNIGKSLCEADKIDLAKDILSQYQDKIILPRDFAVVYKFADPGTTVTYTETLNDEMIAVDVGPLSCQDFISTLNTAQTIIRNGPLGVYERPATRQGTNTIAQAIAQQKNSYRIVGGGDSITALHMLSLGEDDFDHICTGGGAMLSLIGDTHFPTLEVILQS